MKKSKAFTLVEILVVVVVLGILAAVVIPMAAESTSAARDTALIHDLQMLRRYIQIYESQHLEVAPGYPNGASGQDPTEQAFVDQLTKSSKITGETADRGTAGFDYGPYLWRVPENHFNNKSGIQMLRNGENFPGDPDGSHGWIYKAATSEIRPDNVGSDSNGKRYYDY